LKKAVKDTFLAGIELQAKRIPGEYQNDMVVLGIESSCDETAAAVVKDGCDVLSSVVSSQIEIHHQYGGVVPELASRKHIENIVFVVDEAVQRAGLTLAQIDAVSVTQGPGLIGSLLVGFSFAKSFSFARKIPWVGVDHLEGHISSVFLENNSPSFPFVALLVSGGHTSIYYVTSHTSFTLMGQTRDDAAGEAYDKVAKMLDLGYPGGRVIDDLSKTGNARTIVFPRPFLDKTLFDFSFSGLKTAVNRYIKTNPDDYKGQIPDIVASFQEAVIDVLSFKLFSAAKEKKVNHVAVVGGVAANSRLREVVTEEALKRNMSVHIPSVDFCGDNGAMIAAIGYHYLERGEYSNRGDDVYSRSWVAIGKKHK